MTSFPTRSFPLLSNLLVSGMYTIVSPILRGICSVAAGALYTTLSKRVLSISRTIDVVISLFVVRVEDVSTLTPAVNSSEVSSFTTLFCSPTSIVSTLSIDL